MNARCCQPKIPDRDTVRHKSRWKKLGTFAKWMIPGATLVLIPKCPVCVAMYVALFTGISISVECASKLRAALLILCVAVIIGMVLLNLRRKFRSGRS